FNSVIKMSANADLQRIFSRIDANQSRYIDRLRDAVAVRSVSAWPDHRGEVVRMVERAADELKSLGASVRLAPLGEQKLTDGTKLQLPPCLLADLPSNANSDKKKTLLIYGHLDVQPAAKEDGWDTEPFELTERNGNLYGRGSSDDKGPVLGWLNAVEAYKEEGIELPVNLKFCLEAMEESGSEGLDQLLVKERKCFLSGVDLVCISDNYWLGKDKPCLTYGLRGICYFFLEVSCAAKDLHSGVFGGSVPEAMNDLVWFLGRLADKDGKILIDSIDENVAPLTPEEEALYDRMDFSVDEFKADNGLHGLLHASKAKTLQHRWRFPSLSVHGIEGAFYGEGAKTVIPRRVIGKFSIRIVPNQTPDEVNAKVVAYCERLFRERGSPNQCRIIPQHGGRHWFSDFQHPHFQAAAKATKTVYGVEPDMTREGGSIPVTLSLQESTGKNVLLLPMGQADDGAHSQNEKLSKRNYIQGTKLMAAYLHEVGQI
ncbi:hypothetical protein BOX15_Mlig019582g7, partial [Macrostomum lignano]